LRSTGRPLASRASGCVAASLYFYASGTSNSPAVAFRRLDYTLAPHEARSRLAGRCCWRQLSAPDPVVISSSQFFLASLEGPARAGGMASLPTLRCCCGGISFYTFGHQLHRGRIPPADAGGAEPAEFSWCSSVLPPLLAGRSCGARLLAQTRRQALELAAHATRLSLASWACSRAAVATAGAVRRPSSPTPRTSAAWPCGRRLGLPVQIYCDFPLHDMGWAAPHCWAQVGLNFRAPTCANIPDFWPRWHISL